MGVFQGPKRALLVTLSVLLFFFVAAATGPLHAEERLRQDLPPVIMGYMDFPPLMWDDKGIPRGELIELAKEIAEQQGFEIKFVMRPVNRLYKDVAEGKIHVWVGSPFTSTVAGKVLFKNPAVVVAELRLWALKGKPIPELDNIVDQPLIVRRGYKYGGRFDGLAAPTRGLKLVAAGSHADIFDLLRARRALYALDYQRPATISNNEEEKAMEHFHSRLVEEFPSYFNVSKKAPNAERILGLFHQGLIAVRASDEAAEIKSAR